MIKTSAATPSPTSGYSIGDTYEENYIYSAGAVSGNDDFALGGTKNYSISHPESKSLIVKATSATQCDASSVSFSTCNWTLTSLTDIAASTTVTNLTITTYTLAAGTQVVETNKTSTTSSTQDCFLPVSVLSFSGKAENNAVRLSWSTASEQNNDFFTLERSADGKTFSEIGKVNGAGNSSVVRHYEFTDAELPGTSAALYYRLSQTDFDGRRQSLGVVAVNFLSEEGSLSLAVQSNPVTTNELSMNVFSQEEDELMIRITDIRGKSIAETKIPILKGESRLIKMRLENPAAGIYFINICGKSGIINSRFLLLNKG